MQILKLEKSAANALLALGIIGGSEAAQHWAYFGYVPPASKGRAARESHVTCS